MSDLWLSAAECNAILPDQHYDSTVENLASYGVSPDLSCWHLESVPTGQVHPIQLIDDPEDHAGLQKVAKFQSLLREGSEPPPVILVHEFGAAVHPFMLLEGRHRYNAAYQENIEALTAWVAHVGCCGGPDADLRTSKA